MKFKVGDWFRVKPEYQRQYGGVYMEAYRVISITQQSGRDNSYWIGLHNDKQFFFGEEEMIYDEFMNAAREALDE